MSQEWKGSSPRRRDRAWPLYGAAFMMAICLSMAWTAMPFVLTSIGGTDAHVGYAPAVNNLAYMIALLVTGSRLGRLRVRRTALRAGTVALAASAAMTASVVFARFRGGQDGMLWIWTLIAAGGIGGAAMAFYWPFLMGWVSSDYEGVRLNRRLGRYNGAWSSGSMVGPLISGWFFEVHPLLPLVGAVAAVLLSLVLLRFARDSSTVGNGTPTTSQETSGGASSIGTTCDSRLLADCRWISRIGLFSACACYAIMRSQFALVFTSLGYTESQFGLYLTLYASCNLVALMAAGRWAGWHFRPGLLVVAQAMLLLMLMMTLYSRDLSVLFVSSALLGVAYGFAYSSHLYYGVSASRQRSTRMAIHEIVISLGLTIGSAAGGYLCEHVGLYWPYWFAAAVVVLGMIGQVAIHVGTRARSSLDGSARSADAANE